MLIMKALLSIIVATLPLFPLTGGTVLPHDELKQHVSKDLLAMREAQTPESPLTRTYVAPGKAVKPGTELRILCVGDSITVGFLSDTDGGDGNGYRLRLRENLSKDNVEFVGTETAPNGNMTDGYFAAWNGKTIKYMEDHVGPSLSQQANIILVHAGTNDMNPNRAISTEGNNPEEAVSRLGNLISTMRQQCPDAVVLVAMIIDTCNAEQSRPTEHFQTLIRGLAADYRGRGAHIFAVDFTTFPTSQLRDCIHPTNDGYHLMGDYWYFITQIPRDWISAPVSRYPSYSDGSKNSAVSVGEGMGVGMPVLSFSFALLFSRFRR